MKYSDSKHLLHDFWESGNRDANKIYAPASLSGEGPEALEAYVAGYEFGRGNMASTPSIIGAEAIACLRRIVSYYDDRRTPEQAMDIQAKAQHENTMFGEARSILAKGAAMNAGISAATGWRDVVDELPNEAQEVLFVRSGKTVHGAWIGGIFWYNNQKCAAATWRPMPEPPSGNRIDVRLHG